MPPRRPLIVAHRGLHSTVPENSLESMVAAWKAGLAWSECDVHESATGPLFVIHDDTLERTTDGVGSLADRIDAELDGLHLRDALGAVTPCLLPRLSDVLRAMPAHGRLMIEVKAVRDHTELVRDIGPRQVWVQSFDARDLALTAELSSRIPLACLVETDPELEAAFGLPYASVHLDHRMVDEPLHRRLRDAGKAIGVWTVNAEAEMRRLITLGVEVLITDEPALARRVVEELCGPADGAASTF